MAEIITEADREEIQQTTAPVVLAARALSVTNAQEYELAGDFLMRVKGAQKKLAEKKESIMRPLRDAVRAGQALFAEPERELAESESLAKRQMISYEDEQERKRREAQRRADEAAEKERRRLAAEAAETERRAREKAEEQRRQAEAEREAGNELRAQKLEERASIAESQGLARAQEKAELAGMVVPAVIQQEAPKVSGIVTRETWSAIVHDKAALVTAIAQGKVPLAAVDPNMKFLNNQARALKNELGYPGVRAKADRGIAAGSK